MLTVMIIGGLIALCIVSRKRKQWTRGPSRTVTTQTTRTVYTIHARKQSEPNAEKLKQQQRRDADRIRKEQFKRHQAAQDMIHYTQVKKDLITAFDASGAAYGNTEKAIRKRIQYDNAIRRTEKQIEKAAYNARRTG